MLESHLMANQAGLTANPAKWHFGAALLRLKMWEVQFYEHKHAKTVPFLHNFKTLSDKNSFPGPSWDHMLKPAQVVFLV